MSASVFVTVCTRSRLAEAAVLARSLQAVHPEAPRLLYLAERQVLPGDAACGWTVRPVSNLPVPDLNLFLFQYSAFEACCALKPFALEAALGEPGVPGAVWVDGDMLALAPFLDLVEAAWNDADVWLTPHLRSTAAPPDWSVFLRTGAYNAGFLAVRNAADGLRFLAWFRERLARDCVRDLRAALFDDQKWLDLAAALCPGVRPLHYPGLNVGHWNLHEHRYEARPDGSIWLDGATRLALFHFSGLGESALSKHGGGEPPAAIRDLAARYRVDLEARRSIFPPHAPYTWGAFNDGAAIAPWHREAVRLRRFSGPDPFSERAAVEKAAAGITLPVRSVEEGLAADRQLRRLRAHPVIGRVWRFWKRWVNHDLP